MILWQWSRPEVCLAKFVTMAQIPNFDPIDYLVTRRFPGWKIPHPSTYSVSQLQQIKSQKEVRDLALAYEQELRAKAPEEITNLVKTEQATEAEQRRRWREAEENGRFFNQPTARADFTHWGKLSYWTLDEAVALSFGRAPEYVNWKAVEYHANVSPFAIQYKRRRELAIRAKASSELYDPVRPSFFIAWAKRLDWDIPPDLETVVVARGEHLGDWKTAYENESAAHAKTMDWAKTKLDDAMKFAEQQQAKAFEIGNQALAQRDAEIERLREALQAAEDRKSVDDVKVPKGQVDPGPRERDSMLRLIIGMAIRGYTYDPTASKNKAIRDIASDLQFLGIGLDEDTIRKYLQEAKDILPRETE